jgi:hypothetical protein
MTCNDIYVVHILNFCMVVFLKCLKTALYKLQRMDDDNNKIFQRAKNHTEKRESIHRYIKIILKETRLKSEIHSP